jgi:hypothetical protein
VIGFIVPPFRPGCPLWPGIANLPFVDLRGRRFSTLPRIRRRWFFRHAGKMILSDDFD